MQASIPLDIHFHGTYCLVGHFHYALFGAAVFAAISGVYYWFPKMTGRMYNEKLGALHFILAFLGFNGTYLPMFWLGPERHAPPRGHVHPGVHRREPVRQHLRASSWGSRS